MQDGPQAKEDVRNWLRGKRGFSTARLNRGWENPAEEAGGSRRRPANQGVSAVQAAMSCRSSARARSGTRSSSVLSPCWLAYSMKV
jgi:ribosomal protein L15E